MSDLTDNWFYSSVERICDRFTEDANFGKKKRVTIWCGFWSRDIIGLFFFENEQGVAVTVHGDSYRCTLNEFLFTKIE